MRLYAGDYLFTLYDSPPTNDLEFHLEKIILLFRIIVKTLFSPPSAKWLLQVLHTRLVYVLLEQWP